MSDDLMMVWPPRTTALTIHLYLPGFQPGAKARSGGQSMAICGVTANEGYRGRRHQPFLEGFDEVRDPFRWCGTCLGRAVVHYECVGQVIGMIAGRVSRVKS